MVTEFSQGKFIHRNKFQVLSNENISYTNEKKTQIRKEERKKILVILTKKKNEMKIKPPKNHHQ